MGVKLDISIVLQPLLSQGFRVTSTSHLVALRPSVTDQLIFSYGLDFVTSLGIFAAARASPISD